MLCIQVCNALWMAYRVIYFLALLPWNYVCTLSWTMRQHFKTLLFIRNRIITIYIIEMTWPNPHSYWKDGLVQKEGNNIYQWHFIHFLLTHPLPQSLTQCSSVSVSTLAQFIKNDTSESQALQYESSLRIENQKCTKVSELSQWPNPTHSPQQEGDRDRFPSMFIWDLACYYLRTAGYVDDLASFQSNRFVQMSNGNCSMKWTEIWLSEECEGIGNVLDCHVWVETGQRWLNWLKFAPLHHRWFKSIKT